MRRRRAVSGLTIDVHSQLRISGTARCFRSTPAGWVPPRVASSSATERDVGECEVG
jgi:hypothetical protein